MDKKILFLLRLSMGWLMFYAGITKILNPEWTAQGYLKGAKTFAGFYQWLASSGNIGWVNIFNEWGLTLIGIALIFGIVARFASYSGALLMLLYYFPILVFPYAGEHAFIVDDHIIYALVFVFLAVSGAGRFWGLDKWCANLPFCKKYPFFRKLFG